jgi:hypothetical protein
VAPGDSHAPDQGHAETAERRMMFEADRAVPNAEESGVGILALVPAAVLLAIGVVVRAFWVRGRERRK